MWRDPASLLTSAIQKELGRAGGKSSLLGGSCKKEAGAIADVGSAWSFYRNIDAPGGAIVTAVTWESWRDGYFNQRKGTIGSISVPARIFIGVHCVCVKIRSEHERVVRIGIVIGTIVWLVSNISGLGICGVDEYFGVVGFDAHRVRIWADLK